MEIGQANYSTGKQTTIAKIKDGDNIYRILPPLGSMAQKGAWNRFIAVEWGYKDLKNNNRPFQDVRVVNYKTKMIEVESAAHLFREKIAADYKTVVDQYRSGKASPDDVKKAKELTERYNLDKKYYLNAINTKGEIVLLKIGHKAKQGIDAEIKKLSSKGVDPLSLNNGRFFNINRTGTGLSTIYSISVASETIEVPGIGQVQKELVHVIDDKIISRLSSEATDLGTLDKLYALVSPEQVQRFVAEGPSAVTSILGDKESKSSNSGDEDGGGEPELQTNFSTTTPALETVTPVLAPVQAAVIAPIAQATAPIAPAAELSKEDFLKSLGL